MARLGPKGNLIYKLATTHSEITSTSGVPLIAQLDEEDQGRLGISGTAAGLTFIALNPADN